MFEDELEFRDLINIEDWQSIQDCLSEVIDITLRTFSPDGNLISYTSRDTPLCTKIFPKISERPNFCISCLVESSAKNIGAIKKDINLKCPFDLDMFVVPVRAVGEKILAYLILGPIILKERKSMSEYEEEAKRYNVNLEELADALIEINVFSYNKIYAIIKLIKEVFSHIAKTAYHKRRLAEIAPEVAEIDPLFARQYEERILNALLNCCILALKADSGSVMTVDKKTNLLHIKVASKLDEETINKAEVKVGEGIAGVAAATEESIILPKDKDKNGLSEKMTRRYIKSSMIVPFNKKDTRGVYGVINLNLIKKRKEFAEKDIALVRELVNMASLALFPLKQE